MPERLQLPVTFASLAVKVFEHLVLSYLRSCVSPLVDPYQFAYWTNRSSEDAINLAFHFSLQHLESTNTYPRILFILAQLSTPLILLHSSPGFKTWTPTQPCVTGYWTFLERESSLSRLTMPHHTLWPSVSKLHKVMLPSFLHLH